MKQIAVILFILVSTSTFAQTGLLVNRYYISGNTAIGHNDRSFADSSAWIDIGKDTTNKGILFPKVVLDSINTTKRGLFVYDLKDSVLYHFDGNKRIRYMSYKDTILIKNLIATYAPITDSNVYATRSYASNPININQSSNYKFATETEKSEWNKWDTLALRKDGNSFGIPYVYGTKDNQPVKRIVNGVVRDSISPSGVISHITATTPNTVVWRVFGEQNTNYLSFIAPTSGSGGFFRIGPAASLYANPSGGLTITNTAASFWNVTTSITINAGERTFFQIANIERARINNTGNFMIGTTTDNGQKLQVGGTSAFYGLMTIQKPAASFGTIVDFGADGTSVFTVSQNSSVDNALRLRSSSTAGVSFNIETQNNNHILMLPNGTGNVGIKTSNPTEALEVNGNALLSGYIKTAEPTINGAGSWKLGKKVDATVTLLTDKYIEVDIDGTTYKLALVQ